MPVNFECPNCEEAIAADSQFCPQCGSRVRAPKGQPARYRRNEDPLEQIEQMKQEIEALKKGAAANAQGTPADKNRLT